VSFYQHYSFFNLLAIEPAMRLHKISLILFFLAFNLLSLQAESSHIVRVGLVRDVQKFKLAIHSPYQIIDLNTNKRLYKGLWLWQANVVLTESGIKIGRLLFETDTVRIDPSHSPAIYLDGDKFRGKIDIIHQANNTLLAVNRLDVEEYISGVLKREMATWWPMETLKAQTIVARTFTLYQAKINREKEYDLVATSHAQVYGGVAAERRRTTKAVRLTKNKVLTYKNKLFPTFYHATCGGHTESASRLWQINLPVLKGRKCQFCSSSPYFRWKKRLTVADIEEALGKTKLKMGLIRTIKAVDRDISGRVTELEIISTQGKIKISAQRFRLAIGPNIIRSTNFDVEIRKANIYFTGYGWGHGVGMCQWGAFFMARKGFNAQQILDYYYPGSKIKDFSQDYETF
jgi:stage II sporulation protein D